MKYNINMMKYGKSSPRISYALALCYTYQYKLCTSAVLCHHKLCTSVVLYQYIATTINCFSFDTMKPYEFSGRCFVHMRVASDRQRSVRLDG